jgi:hypothetical protein
MSDGVTGVMQALKAENLLGDSQLFGQIAKLCADLTYSTEDGKFSFDDYFHALESSIDAIPKLVLEDDVAPGTETVYVIQLTQSAEVIVDECDRVFRRLNQFEGKLREAERKVANQKAEFVAWYMLAAVALLSGFEDMKLPMAETRKLAEAEFSRLMGGLDTAVSSLIEAVKIEASKVAAHKAAQKEKYNLGKDQANAAWTSTLPAFGNAFSEERGRTSAAQEVEDEDIPAAVKTTPSIAIEDTLRISKPGEVKGTFVKHGDPKLAVPVSDDYPPESIDVLKSPPMSPRRKLILEED